MPEAPKKPDCCHNCCRFTLLVVSAFFAVTFAFDFFSYLAAYGDYPVEVVTSVEPAALMDFPAVTICSSLRVLKSEFCKNTENCGPDSSTSTRDSIQKILEKYNALSKASQLSMAPQLDEVVRECHYRNISCKSQISQYYDADFKRCFTINAWWNKTSKKLPELTDIYGMDVTDNSDLFVELQFRREELTRMFGDQPYAQVYIHSPNTLPTEQDTFLIMEPGQNYRYKIKQVRTLSLAAPYATNCLEYKNMKEKRVKSTATQQSCYEECAHSEYMEKVGCSFRTFVDNFDSGEVCIVDSKKQFLQTMVHDVTHACKKRCRRPCSTIKYEVESVQTESWPTRGMTKSAFEDQAIARLKYAALMLSYLTLDRTVIQYCPKYEVIHIIVTLGGHLALWIAILSLVTMEFHCRKRSRVST